MEQIWSNGAVITALITILVAIAGVLVAVIKAVGDAAVHYIRSRTGLTEDIRRREIAIDAVSAAEQLGEKLGGRAKLDLARQIARDAGVELQTAEIEAALKRAEGWYQETVLAPLRLEGND